MRMRWDHRLGRRLRLKDLHTLQTVAEVGSMAKASERLALSQPAISKAIADMEHTFGTALLNRSSRGVELTECGRLLVERSRVVFDEIRQCATEIEQKSDPAQGLVRIGTTDPVTGVVSKIVNRMIRSYPRMSYHVVVSDKDTLEQHLRERTLDVALTRWGPSPLASDLAAELLFKSPLIVMADRRHSLLRQDKRLRLADLMGEQWVLSPPDSFLGGVVVDLFRRHKLPLPPAVVTTISIYMRLNLLAGGRFLTILPMQMLRDPPNSAWLRAVDVDLGETSAPISLVSLKNRQAGGAVKLFRQASRDVCGDLDGLR
jgi:DNA-binding transcriptional LysR family regulator